MAIDTEHDEGERRAGKNQALFREVNERVNGVNKGTRSVGHVVRMALRVR